MDDDDQMLDIEHTPDTWKKMGALTMYKDIKKRGGKVPKPLQDYIDNSVKNELEGMKSARAFKPYPSTKGTEYNPLSICVLLTYEIECNNASFKKAVTKVANDLDVDRKTIKNAHNLLSKREPGYAYYLFAYMEEEGTDKLMEIFMESSEEEIEKIIEIIGKEEVIKMLEKKEEKVEK